MLPWPNKHLFPNRIKSEHWSKSYQPKKAAKHDTHAICCEAGIHQQKFDPDALYALHWDFYPPDRRRRDDDGCEGAMKWHRDTIAACMRIDDNQFRTTRQIHEPIMTGMVVATITEISKEKVA